MPKLGAKKATGGGAYFSAPSKSLTFIHSGCELLNCALGGGWPLGRVSNIIGDKSTGKTLLAMEAVANFLRQFPKGRARYRESEAAFDQEYAENGLGISLDRVEFWPEEGEPFSTVEQFHNDLAEFTTECGDKVPGIYILDSLDALSDSAEMAREVGDKQTYGTQKAKEMSQLFRQRVRAIKKSSVHLMVISQIRDKINALAFGKKYTRAGGHALDFYASQVVALAYTGEIKGKVMGVDLVKGISVEAKIEKNKVGLPRRKAAFEIMFGFGVDDLGASLDWLVEMGRLDALGLKSKEAAGKYLRDIEKTTDKEYRAEVERISAAVRTVWGEWQMAMLPKRRKYG